jgi:hypothetical protein
MCCFSGPVEKVEATNIFARMTGPARQLLVYEMRLAADAEVAMILPIPVPAGTGEDAVRFLSLERYPKLFDDLDELFHEPMLRSRGATRSAPSRAPLAVHAVGAFEASFVPTLADFDRLDPRFRVPPGTIDCVPAYVDWGFAVFQLAPTHGLASVHPMAFEFPTRTPARLFFPTVHVHDGTLHAHAEFAHRLYAQGVEPEQTWVHRRMPASHPSKPSLQDTDLFELDAPISRRTLFGSYPNTDTWATLLDQP